jgi:hypothetical protein
MGNNAYFLLAVIARKGGRKNHLVRTGYYHGIGTPESSMKSSIWRDAKMATWMA